MRHLYFEPIARMRRLGARARLALAIVLAVTAPGFAGQAAAAFTCHAARFQRCYFSLLHPDGGRSDFVLNGGRSRLVPDAAPEADRYMVAVNARPPANAAACSRSTPVGARRSAWCKISTVRPEGND